MNLDEILSREKIKVTVEVDGERREYTEDFLVMHMADEGGEVLGCVSPIGLVRAVDMLMDSIDDIMEDMSPMDAMMMTIMMGKMMEERVKSEWGLLEYFEGRDI